MGKKKTAAQKKAAASRAVSPLPPVANDELSSPAASSFAKDGNEGSEPNEASPDATTTDMTPTPSMSKAQKKALKANAGAALGDEKAALAKDAPTEPTDKSESGPPSILVTKESDKVKESDSVPNASLDAAAPLKAEAEDDAWGFDETAEQTKPITADIDDSSAKPQNGSPADAQPVESSTQDVPPVENKVLKEDTPIVPAHAAADITTSPPPATKDESNAQVSNPVVTSKSLEETVIPSGVVADSQGQISRAPESGKTGPNDGGISMSSFDDDNKPLAALTNRGKPTIDTHVKSAPGEKQTPGENLGGSGSRSFNTSQGLFSGGSTSVQSAHVSSSPTAPPSGGVGPGSGAPAQAPAPSTPGFNFGFGGSKQTPKPASGTSWGMGSSKAAPAPEPAPKSKWGWSGLSGLANKAQKALENAIEGEHPPQPPRTPAKTAPPPQPQAPAPAPAPTAAPVPPSPVSNTPAPPPPAKSLSIDERLAAIRAKHAAKWAAQKEPKPDEPKSSPASAIPPSNQSSVEPPTSSPIQAPEKAQSDVTTTPAAALDDAQPSMPESAPVDNTQVTSALAPHMTHSPDPQPHANSAESGNDGNFAALSDSHTGVPAAPGSTVSSKTATSGLRLDTQPVPDDSLGRKRDSIEFDSTSTPIMNRRLPLGDPRSSSSSSPKTPFNFAGPGLGKNFSSFGAGRVGIGGNGFAAPGGFARPQHQSPMATPAGEGPGFVGKVEKSGNDDDVSSVTGSVQDVDSNVDDSQLDAAAAVALLPDAPINIDAPALPTTFSLPPVEPLPPPFALNSFQAPPLPPKPADPSPVDFKPFEIPALDKPLATEAPEPPAKDEPPVESPVEAPVVKDEIPVVEPTEAVSAPEEEVKPDEPAVITPLEAAAEVPVESVATPVEPAPASPLERAAPSPVEPTVPSPVEQATPSPVEPIASSPVEPVASSPVEPAPTTPIEPAAIASVEPTPTAPVEEASIALADPVVVAPEEPAATTPVEPTPATPVEPVAPSVEDKETKEVAPAAKPELAIQVPATVDDSSKPKSPEPPTPAAGKGKKKKKKGRKSGAAAEEPVTPSVVSKPGPVSEPAPDAEATSVFFSEPASEPVLAPVEVPEPQASAEPALVDLAPEPVAAPIEAPIETPVEAPSAVETPAIAEAPVAIETLAPLETPAPLEPKTEPTEAAEVVQPTQASEPEPTEAPKESNEPAPEPLKDTKSKEEPASPTATKTSKSKPSKKKKRKSSMLPSEPAPSVIEESPAPPVEEVSRPEAKAPEVVEPVAVTMPVVAAEELPAPEPTHVAEEPLKNEETLTAVPDEGIVTPRAISQPLPESPVDPIPVPFELPVDPPTEPAAELAVEPTPEIIVEPTVERPVEPVADSELVPVPAESPVEAPVEAVVEASAEPVMEPAAEPAVELVIEPTAVPVVEPALVEPVVEPPPAEPIVVEPVAEPVAAPVAEQVVELVSELIPKSIAAPIIGLFAAPSAAPAVEPAAEQQVVDMVQPVVDPVVETANEPAPEPVPEVVPETPKDILPPTEAKEPGVTKGKSSKKKKGSKKKAEVVEETPVAPELTSVVDKSVVDAPISSPVVETVAPTAPVAVPAPIEPAAVSPTTPKKKKKSKKVNAVSPAPTPIEEKMPALPEPIVVATAIPEVLELNDVKAAPVPAPAHISEPILRIETTPKVAPIEIPRTPSPMVVSPIATAPVQLDEVVAPVPEEKAPELEPSPIIPPSEPVVASVAQAPSPVSEPPPLLPSPPRSVDASPRARAAPELLMSPKPSKSSKKSRGDKMLSLSQMPELSSPSPIRPSFENSAATQTATPLSPSPVSQPTRQSSPNITSFGHRSDGAAEVNHRPASRGSVSSITSIDTDTKPSAEKAKVRPSMPPLISIPITPSTPVAVTHQSPAAKPNEMTAASEMEESVMSPGGLASVTPADETIAKSEAAAKPTTPGVLGGFKPFRWFGFGAAPSPIAPSPVVPSPVVASSVVASPVVEKKLERPSSAVASPIAKDPQDQTQVPKETPDPVRNVASPVPLVAPRPRSPVVEKTEWSRWPQPAVNSAALPRPSVNERTPSKREFHPLPRVDSQSKPIRPSVTPVVVPVIPIIPVVVAPAPSKANPSPVSDDQGPVKRASSSSPPRLAAPKVATPVSSMEKDHLSKRSSVASRAVSPASNTPSTMLQSPPSSAGTLPAYSAQAPVVTRTPVTPQAPAASQVPIAPLPPAPSPAPTGNSAPKPVPPRGILKQRPAASSAPSAPRTPVSPPHSNSQASKFEFARSQHVPIYDDWAHAPAVRRDILASAATSRSPQQEQPSATTASPTLSRNRGADEAQQRPRKKHSSKELTSSHKANRARTPSPARGARATSKPVVSPPKPNLVPVFNEKIIRPKAPKPAKISTTTMRSPGGNYVEPLSSPILLTAENYTARLPENTIYQYDGINSSEPLPPPIRKRIFDILQKEVGPQVFSPLARATFDGKRFMYAHKRLNVSSRQEFSVELTGEQAGIYTVRLKKLAEINPQ